MAIAHKQQQADRQKPPYESIQDTEVLFLGGTNCDIREYIILNRHGFGGFVYSDI